MEPANEIRIGRTLPGEGSREGMPATLNRFRRPRERWLEVRADHLAHLGAPVVLEGRKRCASNSTRHRPRAEMGSRSGSLERTPVLVPVGSTPCPCRHMFGHCGIVSDTT